MIDRAAGAPGPGEVQCPHPALLSIFIEICYVKLQTRLVVSFIFV
jgi:hypothetical protein